MIIPLALYFFPLACVNSCPHLKHILWARTHVPSTTLMVHLCTGISACTSLLGKSISQNQGTQKSGKLLGHFSPKFSPPFRITWCHHAYLHFLKSEPTPGWGKSKAFRKLNFVWLKYFIINCLVVFFFFFPHVSH